MSKALTIIEKDGHAAKDKDPNLSVEQLKKLYRTMVMTRFMDERALRLQRQGEIGFYLLSTGQEASHIGAAAALLDSDWLFPAYRQPGIMLLRGADVDDIVNEWWGNEGDLSKGRQMPVHYSMRSINFFSISSPIGTQLSQAAGAAMAAKIRGDDTVFMTFCGDGGTSSNDFHCGLNFGAVFKAPVVFVVENNQWAISVPVQHQTAAETLAAKAQAYGMPGVRVDGNDVLAVYRVCKEAVDRARKGEGPTLVETVTYRMASHSSSDDADRYRDKAEWQRWKKRDPIQRFQKYLEQKGIWTEELQKDLDDEVQTLFNDAINRARKLRAPSVESMFEDVYMKPTEQLGQQLDQLRSLRGDAQEEQGEFPL